MRISLEPDQIRLLQAVADGKVARHRQRVTDGPAKGPDLEHRPDPGLASAYRKATSRMDALRRLGLVEFVRGEPTDENWPWQLTAAGNTALDRIREQTETSIEENA